MQEMTGVTADQSSSERLNGAATAAAGNSNVHIEMETLKTENEKLKVDNATLRARNKIVEKLLRSQLEKKDQPSEEASDVESEDEEEESLELSPPSPRPSPRTLLSENILSTSRTEDMLIPRGVEDSLFGRPSMDKKGLIRLLLENPLESYLLSLHSDTYNSNIKHIYELLAAATEQIRNFKFDRDRLRDVAIPTAEFAISATKNKVQKLKEQLVALEAEIETYEHSALVKADEKEQLEEQHEDATEEVERIEKKIEVATLLKDTMEEFLMLHQDPTRRHGLPLGSIISATDSDLVAFKEKCGLIDYASTRLSVRKHVQIARVVKIFGLEYSPYYKNNGYPCIRVGKHSDPVRLREQTCRILGIEIEDGGSAVAASGMVSLKRKASREYTPAKKRSKTDDSALEKFVSTPGGRDAVMKNPALQEMVQASPALQLAFLAGAASHGDGSESSAEQT